MGTRKKDAVRVVKSIELPVVDFREPNADRDYMEKSREYGFIAALGHGVDPDLDAIATAATLRVGRLPTEALLRNYNQNRKETFGRSGYFPFGAEGAKDAAVKDLKHFWHVHRMGHHVPTFFPSEVPEFAHVMRALFSAM
ncbi:MAG: hypothetical protein RLZZ324_45, partial [Candidatus Parcubacteria bacterium]